MLEFEKGLKERQLPYQLLGGSSVFHNSEIKDYVAYLRVLLNPDDDQAFKRILNIPKRGLGPSSLGQLILYADQHQISLYHSMRHFKFLQQMSTKQKGIYESFFALIEHYRAKLHDHTSLDWINDLLNEIEYRDWLDSLSSTKKQAEKKWRSLLDFHQWVKRLYEKDQNLKTVLNKIMVIDRLEEEQDASSGGIILSTIHASKGLEYDEVYIPLCLEGFLPHHQSLESLEEERRLLYVAMTRAKKRLTLSYPITYQKKDMLKSRFIDEIGKEHFTAEEDKAPLSWDQMRELLGI
jgi:ATP-dependent DNA helicase Rep